MHPEATDSSGAGPGPSPAAAVGAPGERRPEPREDAAAPRGPGGGSWRVAVAVAVLAAASLSYLGPGAAGGAGPGAVLLRLSLYLIVAVAALLLGTLLSFVFRSPLAPPPDFAAAWRRLSARRRPGVSSGLPRPARPPRPGPPASGARRPLPEPRGSRRARPPRPGGGKRAAPRPPGRARARAQAAETHGIPGRSRSDAALRPGVEVAERLPHAGCARRAFSAALLPVLRGGHFGTFLRRRSPGLSHPSPGRLAPRPPAPAALRSHAALGRGARTPPCAARGGCGPRGRARGAVRREDGKERVSMSFSLPARQSPALPASRLPARTRHGRASPSRTLTAPGRVVRARGAAARLQEDIGWRDRYPGAWYLLVV